MIWSIIPTHEECKPMSQKKQTEPSARRVSRQREAGEATRRETRRLVLVAARQEFAERGYSAATVSRIAERANVAVQTLYYAWGSKRELLRGVMETAITGNDDLTFGQEAPIAPALRAVPPEIRADAAAYMRHVAHEYRVLAERASVGWQTYRDAAAVDPDAAEDWQQLMALRRQGFQLIVRQIPADKLRDGLSPGAAADTAWVIASPDTCDQLVRRAGFSYDELEEWVRVTLTAALLK
jgi:AcrR family transcriptional regulator